MRNYKKNMFLSYISFLFLILFFLFVLYIYLNFYYTYNYYKGIYVIDDICEVYVKRGDAFYLKKNPYVYLNSKRRKVKLISTDKINNKYYNVLLKIKNINKDTKLNISIFKSKNRIIDMLIKPWREYED